MYDSEAPGGRRRAVDAALGLLRGHGVTAGDVVAVVVVAGLSLWRPRSLDPPALLVVAGAVLAAAVSRRRPAWALGLIWAAGIVQLLSGTAVFGLEAAAVLVAYRTARHGRPGTVWAAGLSIPVGAALVLGFAVLHPQSLTGVAGVAVIAAIANMVRLSGAGVATVLILIASVLAAPWALGLLIRLDARYRRARGEQEVAQAQAAAVRELAQLRTRQTELAREVHDVVGHSLAVIIAQADAAQLQASGDTGAVRTALAQIAAVGRTSLAEVRGVLSQTRGPAPENDRAELDLSTLIDGVRGAGTTVDDVVTGRAVDLDPATGAVAYRVLQELLTNALKHGAPDGVIGVDRCWTAGGLALRVTNELATDAGPATEGMGLQGVRSRVEAVGASFRTAIMRPPGRSPSFVATAYFPLLVTRTA